MRMVIVNPEEFATSTYEVLIYFRFWNRRIDTFPNRTNGNKWNSIVIGASFISGLRRRRTAWPPPPQRTSQTTRTIKVLF